MDTRNQSDTVIQNGQAEKNQKGKNDNSNMQQEPKGAKGTPNTNTQSGSDVHLQEVSMHAETTATTTQSLSSSDSDEQKSVSPRGEEGVSPPSTVPDRVPATTAVATAVEEKQGRVPFKRRSSLSPKRINMAGEEAPLPHQPAPALEAKAQSQTVSKPTDKNKNSGNDSSATGLGVVTAVPLAVPPPPPPPPPPPSITPPYGATPRRSRHANSSAHSRKSQDKLRELLPNYSPKSEHTSRSTNTAAAATTTSLTATSSDEFDAGGSGSADYYIDVFDNDNERQQKHEEDQFAARQLEHNRKQGPPFQLNVAPATTTTNDQQQQPPNPRIANIDIQSGADKMEGLLMIVLMTLFVERWNVLQISMVKTTDDNNKKEEEETKIENDDTGEGDNQKPPSVPTKGARIVVELPSHIAVGRSGDPMPIWNDLRVLLFSACDDFVLPTRSSRPLIHAFEKTIEPNAPPRRRRSGDTLSRRRSNDPSRRSRSSREMAREGKASSFRPAPRNNSDTSRVSSLTPLSRMSSMTPMSRMSSYRAPISRISSMTPSRISSITPARMSSMTPSLATTINSTPSWYGQQQLQQADPPQPTQQQHPQHVILHPQPAADSGQLSTPESLVPARSFPPAWNNSASTSTPPPPVLTLQRSLSDGALVTLMEEPTSDTAANNALVFSPHLPDPRRGLQRGSDIRDAYSSGSSCSSSGSEVRPGAFQAVGRAYGAPVRHTETHTTTSRPTTTRTMSPRHRRQSSILTLSQRVIRGVSGLLSHASSRHTNNANRNDDESIASYEEDLRDVPVAAEVVQNMDEIEASVRRRFTAQTPEASVVSLTDTALIMEKAEARKTQRNLLIILAVVLIGAVIGLAAGFSRDREKEEDVSEPSFSPSAVTPAPTISMPPTSSPTKTPPPTLATIRERGSVRCCVSSGYLLGLLEAELCRGLAAAVFGDGSKRQEVACDWQNRWQVLTSRSVDAVILSTTHTTSRTIEVGSTGKGYAFSSPYFYDGLVFGGMPEFVECANNLDTYFGVCRRLVVCVERGSTHHDFLKGRLPEQHLRAIWDFENVLTDNLCNVIGLEASFISAFLTLATGSGDHEGLSIGSNAFTKEPLAITTRSGDNEWSLFVETFLQGLFEAEARNITQATASSFPVVSYFGTEHTQMVAHAIESIGNFGEVYERTIGSEIPRSGLNGLRQAGCDGSNGLLYGIPFGSVLDGDPVENGKGTFEDIAERGEVKCAVPIIHRYQTSTFHLEICKVISAALFDGAPDRFISVPYWSRSTDVFDLLAAGEVDVVAGVTSTLFPTLGTSLVDFAFSKPYVFRNRENDDGRPGESYVLVTKSDDHQWSMFVHWVVMSLINAEEMLISKEQGDFAPEIGLFGKNYDRIFRSIISAVGNYDEMYKRGFNGAPRSGCNRLNEAPHGPQHFPFLFQEVV